MILYFPTVTWWSKSDHNPEKKRIEMFCSRREMTKADLQCFASPLLCWLLEIVSTLSH